LPDKDHVRERPLLGRSTVCNGSKAPIRFLNQRPFDQVFTWLGSPIFERPLCRFLHCDCDDEQCRVARRGHPRPAPSEPCMGLSIHTAQASAKASFDTRLHNGIFGVRIIATAIEMVHLKVACSIRPAIVSFHNVANSPSTVLCDGILTGRAQAILPSPDPI
jgi:hypothetical protein